MDITDKKAEAIARMKQMGIFIDITKRFTENGTIFQSESSGTYSALDNRQLERVRKFEREHNALVYFVICSGGMENYLYVSNHLNEWERDRMDIDKKQMLAFVNNLSDLDCSEFGYMGVEVTSAAMPIRVW